MSYLLRHFFFNSVTEKKEKTYVQVVLRSCVECQSYNAGQKTPKEIMQTEKRTGFWAKRTGPREKENERLDLAARHPWDLAAIWQEQKRSLGGGGDGSRRR